MKPWLRKLLRRERRGQSLVEVALFLPILIFVMAGLVEVSNLLVTQNRVTTASRIAAGFGASSFYDADWADVDPDTLECLDGTACDMGRVAINTVTETLDLSPTTGAGGIQWNCRPGTTNGVPTKWLPSSCRT